jgi:hypothetical protein
MNVFEPAVNRIGNENKRYYLLTYTPKNTDLDGKYRRIDVRVKRPDVTVRARRGYFANEETRAVVAEAEGQPDRESEPPKADTPNASSASPAAPPPPAKVEITNYLFPIDQGKVDVPIAVALPMDLVTTEAGNPASRTLTVTVSDGAEQEFARFEETVDRRKSSLVRNVALAPGSYLLQITVGDSGKVVYQSSTQLDVPARLDERFGLSSIAPIYPPEQAPDKTGPPIRATSTLSRGEDVYLHFRIFPGKRGGPSRSTHVTYSIFRDGVELHKLKKPDPIDLTKSYENGYPMVAKLPMGKLSPGDYRIRVLLEDERLGRRATGEIFISIR